MPFRVSHLHVKTDDPKTVADWYVKNFKLKILTDEVRVYGDRFIRCTPEAPADFLVIFSGPRTGETLGPAPVKGTHHGLEHFAFDSEDMDADVKRLVADGASISEGPITAPNGNKIVFMNTPGNVRIEMIQPAKT